MTISDLEDLFDSQQWQEFAFATVSEPAQRPTEPQSLWVPGDFARGKDVRT